MQFFEVLVHFLEIGVHDVVVRGLVIRILIGTGILRVRVDRDAGLLEQLLDAAGSGRHLGGVLRFDGALGLLDALGDGGLLLFAHALRGLAGLIDELFAAVARDGLGLELRVLRGVLLRFAHGAVDVGLAHVGAGRDRDGLGLAGVEILGRDVHDAVRVDGERDLDLRDAARRAADAGELEAAKLLVLAGHRPFAL